MNRCRQASGNKTQLFNNDIDLIRSLYKLEDSKMVVYFHPEYLTFFEAKGPLIDILDELIDDSSGLINVDLPEIFDILREIKQIIVVPQTKRINKTQFDNCSILSRLMVEVTNSCNLDCGYCFVRKAKSKKMDLVTAKAIVDSVVNHFDVIRSIQFYGGEPLLNLPVIEYICSKVVELFNLGKIKNLPQFGMLTNATLISDEVLSTIERYSIEVTVSLDGPEYLNDMLRTYPQGKGTFKKITDGINKLKYRNIKYNIEATYTNEHYKAGWSMMDLRSYLKDTFEPFTVIVREVTKNSEDEANTTAFDREDEELLDAIIKMKTEIVQSEIESLTSKNLQVTMPLITGMIGNLLTRSRISPLFCGTGDTTLAVSADGDIFPCHRFIRSTEFNMGSICDNTPFENTDFTKPHKFFENHLKTQRANCSECWALHLCRLCLADIGASNDNVERWLCKTNRAIIETVILETAAIFKDPVRMQNLRTNMLEDKKEEDEVMSN